MKERERMAIVLWMIALAVSAAVVVWIIAYH
jgi:predicted nucleic acid-binding Zn ribbon protein